jgi:hypothetical protein
MKDNNDLYLDLLEKVLLGVIYEDRLWIIGRKEGLILNFV